MHTTLSVIAKNLTAEEEKHLQELDFLFMRLRLFSRNTETFIRDFWRSQNANGDNFNILNCLTRHHLEELHSRVLFYLLDPNGNYNCSILFLSLFIKMILKEAGETQRFPSDEKFLSRSRIFRELSIDNQDDIYGRIDLFIETPEYFIAIENKIGAREQDRQLERYSRYCSAKKKCFFIVYLTPFGTESKQSRGLHYLKISYEHHILEWLNTCIASVPDELRVATGLTSYKEVVENRILKTPSKTIVVDIKKLLLSKENHIILKYWKEINAAIIPVRNDLRSCFFAELARYFTSEKIKCFPADGRTTPTRTSEIWLKKSRGFTITDDRYVIRIDETYVLNVCIEQDWDDLYFGLFLHTADTTGERLDTNLDAYNQEAVKKYLALISSSLNISLSGEVLDFGGWIARKPFRIDDMKFVDDVLNYRFATEMKAIIELFIKELQRYLNAVNEINISQLAILKP
ncbi:PD-(D/E)XK nuclease family protein [Pedobacter sp. SAFR-022]|uniref:PDDEXK-like family protein n=1 Tax=Pedobacter sp. SAFR-022 TaxID=3436861 RepID=UPI003F7FD221